MAIVDRVHWPELDLLVETQQRNREAHAPVVSLFRWWARRPHAVVGTILDAAIAEFNSKSFIVADPFSGGGTVAFEAVRRGLPTYAQDLYPWPSLGLATCLRQADTTRLGYAGTWLLDRLESYRRQYWREERGINWEVTHILRVRIALCRRCQSRMHLFRQPLISLASRRSEEKQAFFGCAACGAVSRRAFDIKSFKCDFCGWR
jgi:putative DNA methylase